MMRMRVMGLMLCIAATTPVIAAEVVALGASNTAGKGRGATPLGVSRAQAFPAQLERMLHASGCKVRVANAGVAGDTTRGMLARLPRIMGKDTRVVILQPGGNDARQGDASDAGANIEAIRSYVTSRGARIVMLENLGRIAPRDSRLADGQHFSAAGHFAFAEYVLSNVRSGAGC